MLYVMKSKKIYRFVFYLIGLAILALGLILNTKSNFGVSPILSLAYALSSVSGISFAKVTFAYYIFFVMSEIILHTISKVNNLKVVLLKDLAQIIVTIIFTSLMNLFAQEISVPTSLAIRILFLILGVLFTGIGCAITLDMYIVPNPGDGIVQAVADFIHKRVGITKNFFDLSCVILTCLISYIFAGKLIGVGIGTVVCVIGVGRTITFFNDLCREKLTRLCGVNS